jgi:hypothetical protein
MISMRHYESLGAGRWPLTGVRGDLFGVGSNSPHMCSLTGGGDRGKSGAYSPSCPTNNLTFL